MNIARVGKTHGSKGEVSVAPLRGLPFLLQPGMHVCLTPPSFNRDRFTTVECVAGSDDAPLVRFGCCSSLDDAEGIVGCHVLVSVDEVDIGPLDVAYDRLVGRPVVDVRYGELGCVREVMETPANDVWVIDGGRYGEVLVPVIEDVVADIPHDGPISVHIMDGLLDL